MLTGRIDGEPSQVYHDEVLAPQFAHEVAQLLPWYLAIEKVLLLEYARLGLAGVDEVRALGARLGEATPELIRADRRANLSDIAFAVERHVADGAVPPFPAWHVDRSRNDLQAAAQRLAARAALVDAADGLLDIARIGHDAAARTVELPMPGHTHLQAAQVISPGFYLAALVAETLTTLRRLELSYAEVDQSPLGAGAMAGQELAWDRERMARLLGFGGVVPHALVAVASRGWALSIAADLSSYGVVLSRFTTDLMMWSSGEYGFLDLPDELCGISSAMPQKKNFPILERIRARSAHLTAFSVDLALGQRGSPYTNMVEVSKEAGVHLWTLFETLGSTLRLFGVVLASLRWQRERMAAACAREYLGGFSLANRLTLRSGIPWRTAQVLAGRYIVAATERGLAPGQPDGELLATLGRDLGYPVPCADQLLAEAFGAGLRDRGSPGSAHPDRVRELLAVHAAELDRLRSAWTARRVLAASTGARIDAELGLGADPGGAP